MALKEQQREPKYFGDGKHLGCCRLLDGDLSEAGDFVKRDLLAGLTTRLAMRMDALGARQRLRCRCRKNNNSDSVVVDEFCALRKKSLRYKRPQKHRTKEISKNEISVQIR